MKVILGELMLDSPSVLAVKKVMKSQPQILKMLSIPFLQTIPRMISKEETQIMVTPYSVTVMLESLTLIKINSTSLGKIQHLVELVIFMVHLLIPY